MQLPVLAMFETLDALLQEGSVSGAARRLALSTAAVSHALAKIRERIGDPLLVRAGRAMVLTPRALALKPAVRAALVAAERALVVDRPFAPAELDRGFVIHASDHVLTVLGVELDRMVAAAAPRVTLRFVANQEDDAARLREGAADLAIGIYDRLPPELRTRQLLTDRFVCVVRADHPGVGRRLTLAQFVALSHIQVAPRGKPGGYVDDVLRERGLERRVARAVPFFLAALRLTAQTDHVLTISERIATIMAPCLGLRVLEPPLPLRPYALALLWHPRLDADPAHRWLRETLIAAAAQAASGTHGDARTQDHRPRRRPGARRARAS
ncbi:MAG: LysR family transcriptional regulator [Kofleriaceae bacterium]